VCLYSLGGPIDFVKEIYPSTGFKDKAVLNCFSARSAGIIFYDICI
jgi:hypothetical protein